MFRQLHILSGNYCKPRRNLSGPQNVKQHLLSLKSCQQSPFDPSLPVTVSCDANPVGIAGVLSHIIDGVERPVEYMARALTAAERNYSQLDREAVAIVFSIQKFYRYLYGRSFTLITDNRPLTRIFQQDAKLPAITSTRLLRYAAFLSNFDYKVKHRKAEEHGNVNYLSRAPWESSPVIQDEDEEINEQVINHISTSAITSEIIAEETSKDKELSKLREELASGKIYDPIYNLHNNIVFRGRRVFIPASLRSEILKELHCTYPGISKMKNLARRYCYWRNIDKEIEELVRSCPECAKIQNEPKKVSLHHWEDPKINFQRVHIDYAGPFQGHQFFILVDAKSKWPEVRVTGRNPTSTSTIHFLENIFSSHGLPEVMVSDNATIFKSEEFRQYCKNNGIFQKFIAPGHAATNGLAERYVQILKRKLKAMENKPGTITAKIEKILYRFRATPLQEGKSPSELYLNRQIRTKLDLWHPSHTSQNLIKNSNTRQLSVRNRVLSRAYGRTKHDGYIIKRHINQLRLSGIPMDNVEEKSVCVNPKIRYWYPVQDDEPEVQPPHQQAQDPEEMPIPQTQSTQAANEQNMSRGNQKPILHRSERIRKPPTHLKDFVQK
ncbi:uncharacterized protein K02A2.6-like [Solenopsis invicta]|uniref:uncharacterized protein K02A2.6-like n=1 Tax=Solenopsis invicta TaxID=13686 RepID=UPI00193D3EA0|nr:uncharacterized protein K02A2.6-like [Solenopsis invicta]